MSDYLNKYGDLIDLDIPISKSELEGMEYNWVQYNPRKDNKRYGCSITSLDGGNSGRPDLDSLREYNKENNTKYNESSFKIRTIHSTPFDYFLDNVDIGRSHFLNLKAGGHFPWHRDYDKSTFRIIYTISGCNKHSMVWLEDDRLLHLEDRRWYYINTKLQHAVFSFDDKCVFAVFNVLNTIKSVSFVENHFSVM